MSSHATTKDPASHNQDSAQHNKIKKKKKKLYATIIYDSQDMEAT